jgi:hypothetical protein
VRRRASNPPCPARQLSAARLFLSCLVVCLGFPGVTAYAARNQVDRTGTGAERFQYTPDESKIWRESTVAPPAWPEEANLLALPMSRNDTVKVFVDSKSVIRASDRVLRLTLVVESQAGARSVFFEGIRCETREYKTYAIGTVDRRFRLLNAPVWKFIERNPLNEYRYKLYDQYACESSNSAREPQEFIESLK